jgi:hypothetical protein
VPSGGDWSLHRGAAVEVTDAEFVDVFNCTFSGIGGNALLWSNHVAQSSVRDSEFVFIGDSAIVGARSRERWPRWSGLALTLSLLAGLGGHHQRL